MQTQRIQSKYFITEYSVGRNWTKLARRLCQLLSKIIDVDQTLRRIRNRLQFRVFFRRDLH
jgi:hypothetical protein